MFAFPAKLQAHARPRGGERIIAGRQGMAGITVSAIFAEEVK